MGEPPTYRVPFNLTTLARTQAAKITIRSLIQHPSVTGIHRAGADPELAGRDLARRAYSF
jgi:hypothetical protein